MPAPDYTEDFQAGPAPSSGSSEKIYTVLLIIAAACFLVAVVTAYMEYDECYSGHTVPAEVE